AHELRDAMVAAGLPEAEATGRIWALARRGLITDDMDGVRDFQRPWARPAAEVAGWQRDAEGRIGLEEVVRRAKPTILVGTSLLPLVNDVRATSVAVAMAVAAAARDDGVARATLEPDLEAQVRRSMWEPVYRPVRPG